MISSPKVMSTNLLDKSKVRKEIFKTIKKYERRLEKHQWYLLEDSFIDMSGLAEASRVQAGIRASLASLSAEQMKNMVKGNANKLKKHLSALSDSERKKVINKIISNRPDGISASEMKKMLTTIKIPKMSNFSFSLDAEVKFHSNAFTILSSKAATSVYTMTLGQAHKEFKKLPVKLRNIMEADLESIKNVGRDIKRANNSGFRKLYGHARKSRKTQMFEEACKITMETASLLGRAGVTLSPFIALSPGNKGSLMKYALHVSDAVARRLLLHAYALTIIANKTIESIAPNWFHEEVKRANKLSYSSAVPAGRKVSVSTLKGSKAPTAGEMIEISGQVKNLANRIDPYPPKFSSFFDITDHRGSSVMVRSHMRSLIANGLREDSYCHLVGQFRKNPSWAKGEVGIDIDRISLTSLRKESWLDDITYRMRPLTSLYRDELQILFTPKPY